MLTKLIIKNLFRMGDDIAVMIGTKIQKGSLYAPVKTEELWHRESFIKKLKSIFTFTWTPSEHLLQEGARYIFMNDIFGTPKDYGDKLFKLTAWHNSREWNLSELTVKEGEKADAIQAMAVLTRLRYEDSWSLLKLNLYEKVPFICILSHPMVVKIPILSFQYYLDIHTHFAFNSIRKAKHPEADSLIDYLYEILYLQQKTGISLHELLWRVDYSEKHKNDALFINAEVNAIMNADLTFSYLKATIEKIIVLVGLTHGIKNLDSKKNHKAKMSALKEGLPSKLFEVHYFQFMFNLFSSENLDELNSYRSGILHKRGISDLQPHNYVNKDPLSIPLMKVFSVIHEQHAKNTAALIGALALLTDKLVELDPPTESIEEIPR
jgi:hypothetical protein